MTDLDARVSEKIGEPPRFSFIPSTDWNHAMHAAEKAFPRGFVVDRELNTWFCYGKGEYDGHGRAETGPEAICRAILGEGVT